MTAPLRVLIADDQALVRSGLALIIEAQPDMEVAGEAEDGREALAQCRQLAPDVALLDVRMPGLDGLEAARRLVRDQPATRVVMLTTFDLDSYLYEALKIGVSGFFLKDDPPEQLTAGIRAVVTGAALLAPRSPTVWWSPTCVLRRVGRPASRSGAPGSSAARWPPPRSRHSSGGRTASTGRSSRASAASWTCPARSWDSGSQSPTSRRPAGLVERPNHSQAASRRST